MEGDLAVHAIEARNPGICEKSVRSELKFFGNNARVKLLLLGTVDIDAKSAAEYPGHPRNYCNASSTDTRNSPTTCGYAAVRHDGTAPDAGLTTK